MTMEDSDKNLNDSASKEKAIEYSDTWTEEDLQDLSTSRFLTARILMKQIKIYLILEPGDVVLLDFPGANETKRRPAVILSSRLYHRVRPDVILGLITTQLNSATSFSDYHLRDWSHARLSRPSAFRSFLITLPRSVIKRRLGKLSSRDWAVVREKIQLALG